MAVLIPAYEPTARLAEVVSGLRRLSPDLAIVVVDDGSGPSYDPFFQAAAEAGAQVLRHPVNLGKGAALKRGLRHLLASRPGEDVVTADSDGQHTPGDILRVARAVAGGHELVLGCRAFTGGVPWASRLGNAVSRGLFRLAAGFAVSDTQTGLRGIPAALVGWAAGIAGSRFEYEQNVLLRCTGAGVAVREIRIETLYFDHNSGTHFRRVADSARVLWPVVAFAGSSLLAFAIDNLLFVLLYGLLGSLAWSILLARLVSATVNFLVNGRMVFGCRGRGVAGRVAGYLLLAGALVGTSIAGTWLLAGAGLPALAAKVLVEAALFVASYTVQQRLVFADRGPAPGPERDPSDQHSRVTEDSKAGRAG
ncbi:MAG: glycosyltransferase [Propionicimonas sp.]|nr:glycosyltransferase [Propionicimonas sp.]